MAHDELLYQKIIEEISTRPVSQSLTDLIILAHKVGDAELERWAKLESEGYVAQNAAMRNEDIVPEYRTVVGVYMDYWDNPLVIEDPQLYFVEQERLRHPVVHLEDLANASGRIAFRESSTLQLLKEHLGVEVHKFVFSRAAVRGVLNAIRNQMLERLRAKRADVGGNLQTSQMLPQARRIVFVSKSFAPEDREINDHFESILRALRIPFQTAEEYEGVPIWQKVESRLTECDFLIGIYVKRYEDTQTGKVVTTQWLIREAGFIKAEGKDFIALVEEDVSDIAGFDAEKELILFSRTDEEKRQQATVRFVEALVFHGFVRGNT